MPTADEILASLDEPEGTEETTDQNDNANFRAVRKAAADWEKRAKALEKENADLLAFKTEVENGAKRTSARDALAALGLNDKQAEKQAELFLKVHEGDVTSDAVAQFAVDYGLIEEKPEGEETPTPERKGFEPGGPGGVAGGSPSQLMSRDDWEALYFRDKDAAMKVAAAGKVDMDRSW